MRCLPSVASPARARSAAESVRAGRVRIGRDGPVAVKPSQLVAEDAELLRHRAASIRLARRDQARERARDARHRRRRARLPRRRRLDRRLHRLPARPRRRARDRARRRPRPARLGAAKRPPGRRWSSAATPATSSPAELPWAPQLITVDVSFISLAQAAAGARGAAWPRTAELLALVKPQFELGPKRVGKGGVVSDADDAPRGAACGRAGRRATPGSSCAASPPPGCPARRATARRSSGLDATRASRATSNAAIAEVDA